jgi:hypothetical protein
MILGALLSESGALVNTACVRYKQCFQIITDRGPPRLGAGLGAARPGGLPVTERSRDSDRGPRPDAGREATRPEGVRPRRVAAIRVRSTRGSLKLCQGLGRLQSMALAGCARAGGRSSESRQ